MPSVGLFPRVLVASTTALALAIGSGSVAAAPAGAVVGPLVSSASWSADDTPVDPSPDPDPSPGPTTSPSTGPTASGSPTPTGSPTSAPTALPGDGGDGDTLRILLTGDSITTGKAGDTTWRYWVWQAILDRQVDATFVGTKTTMADRTTNYAHRDFNFRHAATSGIELRQAKDKIQTVAAATRPDVVVVLLGTNDLNRQHTVGQILADMKAYITQLREAAPDVAIVIGQIPGSCVSATRVTRRPQDLAAVNAGYANLAQAMSTPRSPIVVARTSSGWSPWRLTYDCVHPTPAGDLLIGRRVVDGLVTVGALPTGRELPSAVGRWDPRLSLAAGVSSGRRVTLRWDRSQVHTTSVRIVQRCVQDKRTTTWRTAYTGTRATSERLEAGGTYEFRAVAIRHRMTSLPGPVVRVTIPGRTPARPAASVRRTAATATVRWKAVAGAGDYLVQMRAPGGKWIRRTVAGDKRSVTIGGLRASVAYTVQVTARNGFLLSPARILTLRAWPTSPSGLKATAGRTSVVVRWKPGVRASAQQVRLTAGRWTRTLSLGPTRRSVEVKGLRPGTSYTVVVRSANGTVVGRSLTLTVRTRS